VRVALLAPLVSPIGALHLGGAQAVVADLATALVARGHDVVVYASRGSALPGVTLADVDVDAVVLHADLFREEGHNRASLAMQAAYRAVYAHVRAGAFDVVHNHGFDDPAVSVATELGIPVLHTLHLPPGPAMAGAIGDARRLGSARVWCAAVSETHATAWRRVVDVDAVLRNGVPVDRVPFVAEAGTVALVAARFSAEKGVAEGIAAGRQAGWPVVVYGTPYDSAYERAVRSRWAGDTAVTFKAPVERTELWRALGSAGVVLCLSRWDEPFGMVAAEAQAAGTPVIASHAGGLAEVVEDGVTGYLVPRADVAAAVAALARVDGVSREACRRHAHAALGLEQAVDAHERVYAALAAVS
jgi:UDP-glucose:tetrahydrobiopterin glucosyltransferase